MKDCQDLQLRVRLDYNLLIVYIFCLIKKLERLLLFVLFQPPRVKTMGHCKVKFLGKENDREKKAQSVMLKDFRRRYLGDQKITCER